VQVVMHPDIIDRTASVAPPTQTYEQRRPRIQTRPATVPFVLAVVGVLAAIFVLGLGITPRVLERFHYNDFGTFYRATASGRLYGPDPYLPDTGPVTFRNLNPPHFHLLFRPLTLLPLPQAYILWLVLTTMAIGVGLWRTGLRVRPRWPWWMWAVILAWSPLFSLLYTGQITALVFIPLVFAWWADREARTVAAGAWLGLALSLKPHLVLLLVWWVFRGRWRSLTAALVTGGGAAVCGAAVYGWSAYARWISHLSAASWPWAAMNCSLWALPSRLWHVTPYYANLAERPHLVVIATALLVVPVALCTLVGLRKSRNTDVGWALALSATFIVMPLGWAYYAWWWVPVAMGLPLSRRTWAVVAVSMAIPSGVMTALANDSVVLTMSLASAPVYGSVVLWGSILHLAFIDPAASPLSIPESTSESRRAFQGLDCK
jgi:Glycosyltransferase family 87